MLRSITVGCLDSDESSNSSQSDDEEDDDEEDEEDEEDDEEKEEALEVDVKEVVVPESKHFSPTSSHKHSAHFKPQGFSPVWVWLSI